VAFIAYCLPYRYPHLSGTGTAPGWTR
jgi:hypothetical protein